MKTSILIDKEGVYINPVPNLLNSSPITGQSDYSLFKNQITLRCYTAIEQLTNGLYVPVRSSVVRTGLSGTIVIKVWPDEDAPYPVSLQFDTIDISDSCVLQWEGITGALDIICNNIVGANYLNLMLDRA